MRFSVTLVCLAVCLHSWEGSCENSAENPNGLLRVRRGGLNMLRLGRGVHMLRLGKRNSGGDLSTEELRTLILALLQRHRMFSERQTPLPRYGKDIIGDSDFDSNQDDALTRVAQLLRRSRVYPSQFSDDDEEYFSSLPPSPRLGRIKRSAENSVEDIENQKDFERAPPIPRIGRLIDDEDVDDSDESSFNRRMTPLPRFGWCEFYDDNGDCLSFDRSTRGGLGMLRLGKRRLNMLRMGKRHLSMLRLGKRQDEELAGEKRSLRLLRLGKKSESEDSHTIKNRALSMLRLGRSEQTSEDKQR